MYLKSVPIFYFPWFRKSLEKQARHSGFLTPNIGNSSRRGQSVGLGYFWAINRSYDVLYRTQYYTNRGFVHEGNFEGWINSRTTFNVTAYGAPTHTGKTHTVTNSDGSKSIAKDPDLPGGYVVSAEAQSFLGRGWEARGELRQLSALPFRQEFTQSFDEAINSETHSIGFVTKHWKDYGFNLVAQRNVNFQTDQSGDTVVIRKLPEAQFTMREHELGDLPVWISLDSSYGLQRRTQPLFQTRQFVQRLDFAPRVTTAWHVWGFDLSPSFGIRQTMYDSRRSTHVNCDANTPTSVVPQICGETLTRSSRDVQFDLGLPRLSRIFAAPKWMRAGDQVKHVVEARARYRYVTGIDDFRETLRFDEVDLLSNTHEVEFSLTNRLLQRDGAGGVQDVISWQLWYKRYLDPTFGGAIIPGQRNVVDSSTGITGYAFLDGYRSQSPIASVFRVQSRVGVEWRSDYDLVRHGFVNSTLSLDGRFGQFFVVAAHSQLRTNQVLAPTANQLRGQIQYGGDNRRGWNYGFSTGYDYKIGSFQYMQSQATYNTDCCGFSVQYRRFNFNVIDDNQFRVAFAIANIGSFGTLRRQERIF
jgi:LPS-assembly protein